MGPVRRRWPLEMEPNKCNQTSASIIHRMYTYECTPSGPLLFFSYLSYMAFVGILECDCYIIALLKMNTICILMFNLYPSFHHSVE